MRGTADKRKRPERVRLPNRALFRAVCGCRPAEFRALYSRPGRNAQECVANRVADSHKSRWSLRACRSAAGKDTSDRRDGCQWPTGKPRELNACKRASGAQRPKGHKAGAGRLVSDIGHLGYIALESWPRASAAWIRRQGSGGGAMSERFYPLAIGRFGGLGARPFRASPMRR